MKYKLLSVTRKGDNIVLKFYCKECVFAETHSVGIPHSHLAQMFKLQEGVTTLEELPKELRDIEIDADVVSVKLPAPHIKLYTRNITDSCGRIIHSKGSVILDANGCAKVHDEVRVFCPWVEDSGNPGHRVYLFGTPEERMHRMLQFGWERFDL